MAYGILFLRVVVGAVLFGHGAQKLFGWFGGHGPRGTAGFFGSLGFRPPLVMAVVAGLSEASGVLLALGLLTPFACLAIATTMLVAIGSVHLRNGLWVTEGGFEYNLVLWTVTVAIAATGPGRFSLDAAIGWADNLSGLWWGVGVAVVSLATAALLVSIRRPPPEPEATDEPIARERDDERVRA
jgi:putative oxidoreductase